MVPKVLKPLSLTVCKSMQPQSQNCLLGSDSTVSAHEMDGWMTCDFTFFLTVFQSYQDDVRMIMKGCVQWNSVYG